MSITTYAELKTAVANWLGRDDLTDRIPEFISLAEGRLARNTKLRLLEQETTVDVSISSQTIANPATRFLGARRLYQNAQAQPQLAYMPSEDFWQRGAVWETGTPKFYTIEGTNISFAPAPDSTYTGKLLYWQRWAALSDASDTNWLLTNHAGAYLYAALLESGPYIGDDGRALTWATMLDDLVDELHLENQQKKYPSDIRTQHDVGMV